MRFVLIALLVLGCASPPDLGVSDWTSASDGAWSGNTHSALAVGDRIYFSYVDGSGNVAVRYREGGVTSSELVLESGGDADHHDNASLVLNDDGKLVAAWARHLNAALHRAIIDVDTWSVDSTGNIDSSLGGGTYSYAEMVKLDDGTIYLFYRDGSGTSPSSAHPTATLAYSTSTDGGATWAAQTALYRATNHWSYWVVETDGTRIDIATSDGRPPTPTEDPDAHTPYSSLYHFYLSGGNRYKSDGTQIMASLPLDAGDLTKIYDGTTGGEGVRAPYDILTDGPTVVWATQDPAGDQENTYRWARWSGSSWDVEVVGSTGSVPVSHFQEAGIALSRPYQVYAGRYDSGAWKMYRGQRPWSEWELVGGGSGPEIHPVGAGEWVLWSNGTVETVPSYVINANVRADEVRHWTVSALAGAQSAWPSFRP